MRLFFISSLVIILLSSNHFSEAKETNSIHKETFVYSIKNQDTLCLDKYDLPVPGLLAKPCVIFVFGGGFSSGSKNSEETNRFMNELAGRGYVAIAIDYRLGMKNVQGKDGTETISSLVNSIQMAVEDLYDATSFVYQNADKWNINKNQVIACGSSAGAITVLQAEYNLCSTKESIQKLPEGFRYGGIISFAGAILKSSEENKLVKQPSPIQLFHGNADANVPYNQVEFCPVGLYGSYYIVGQLEIMNLPYYFYQIDNIGHEMATIPMKDNLNEIDSFIRKMVINKEKIKIHTVDKGIDRPEKKKDFTLMDYIQSNYN